MATVAEFVLSVRGLKGGKEFGLLSSVPALLRLSAASVSLTGAAAHSVNYRTEI